MSIIGNPILLGGGGSSITVESLGVTQNGTYTAPAGKAYSPVTVNVSGGVTPAEQKDVNFIDYDGTILYSYTKAEFANLSALPANPSHTGLTAQGWNWSLSDAKTYVASYGKLWIGQMYTTSDGKTRIYIHLESPRLSPYLGIAVNGTATVNWGDGSSNSTVTGTSTSTVKSTQHNYAAAGDYIIAISVSGSMQFMGDGTYNWTRVLYANASGSIINLNRVYHIAIRKVEIGANTRIGSNAFAACTKLAAVNIPSGITSIGDSAFRSCTSLAAVTIPTGITSMGGGVFYQCGTLSNIAIPSGTTSITSTMLAACTCLAAVTIPSEATSIPYQGFYQCSTLPNITIPSRVTSIGNSAFGYCYSLGEIHFKPTTPPTVSNSNVWTSLSTDCIIYIPYSALAGYLSASNYPNKTTYTYIGYATYNSGVTLPTQDSTAAYNVVWYASKVDALAQTNVITQGNGNEIYCRYTAV